MRRSLGAVAVSLAASGWAMGAAAVGPTGTVLIGSDQFPVQFSTEDGKIYHIGDIERGQTFISTEGTVTLTGTFNNDPSLNYGLVVTDLGAPSNFNFFFSLPIVPTGFPNIVTGSLVGGLTDATGDGVTLTPTGVRTQISSLSFPATAMGVDVGLTVSGGPGAAGSLYGYGPFASGAIPGPGPGPWTSLTVQNEFSLTGAGDIAALTGSATIVAPEPAIGLVMLGLAGIAAGRRRRGR